MATAIATKLDLAVISRYTTCINGMHDILHRCQCESNKRSYDFDTVLCSKVHETSHLFRQDIRVRPVILYMTSSLSAEVICRANRKWGDRFIWLVCSRDRLAFSKVLSDGCDGGDLRGSIVLFEVPSVNTSEVKVSDIVSTYQLTFTIVK